MNRDRLYGYWKLLRGKARERWGRLTDDDSDVAAGRSDQLDGKIQQRYAIAQEEADKRSRSGPHKPW